MTADIRNAANWFEIPVTDIARACTFYKTIFAIEMKIMDMGELKMCLFPEGPMYGALCQHAQFYSPAGEGGVLLYLNGNPDLRVVESRIEAAGGKVLVPKKMISPEHGFMAIFLDTEGNRVALHSNN